MSKNLMLLLATLTLAIMFLPQAYASSVDVEVRVAESLDVAITIKDLDVISYYFILQNETKTLENVKASFEKSFEDLNLTAKVSVEPLVYEEENYSITIHARFSGSSVIDVSVDPKSLNRTYEVTTLWRKFELKLTKDYSIYLDEIFDIPVYMWNITENVISLHTEDGSFAFVLPEDAEKISVDRREIISFVVPPSLMDKLINSPIVALIGIMLVPVVALGYRRIKLLKTRIKR